MYAGRSVGRFTNFQKLLILKALSLFPTSISVLIHEGIDVNAVDENSNNALHLAVKEGHIGVVKVLLTESDIDAEAANDKGQTPMHCLGQYGKDNAAAIFDLFLECMPQYPLDTEGELEMRGMGERIFDGVGIN